MTVKMMNTGTTAGLKMFSKTEPKVSR